MESVLALVRSVGWDTDEDEKSGWFHEEESDEEEDLEDTDYVDEDYSERDMTKRIWLWSVIELHEHLKSLAPFPWLAPWAQAALQEEAEQSEALRREYAASFNPIHLLEAAAATLMESRDLPLSLPGATVAWSTEALRDALERLKDRWTRRIASCPEGVSEDVVADLVHHILPKGESTESAQAMLELAESWAQKTRNAVEHFPVSGDRWVLLQLRDFKVISWNNWWAAVIAHYTMAADWRHPAVLMRVPEPISHRLEEESGQYDVVYTEKEASTDADPAALLAETLNFPGRDVAPLLPGVLDDGPVHQRRMLTEQDTIGLQNSTPSAHQPYLVFSATHGVEVLFPPALQERCQNGWEGVLIAGASDLPSALIEGILQPTGNPDRNRRDPFEENGLNRLSRRHGEHSLISFSQRNHEESDRAARFIAMARVSPDLRSFAEESGREFYSMHLEYALLDSRYPPLDLGPFQPMGQPLQQGSGLGLPLAHLAQVQIYTTNARQRSSGRTHSPSCQHAPGLGHKVDLITPAEFLQISPHRLCSICGGHAVRLLDEGQLTYYQAARELHRLWNEVNEWPRRWRGLTGENVTRLREELNGISLMNNDPRMDGRAIEQWNESIHQIRIRLNRIDRFIQQPNKPAKPRSYHSRGTSPSAPKETMDADVRVDFLIRGHVKSILERASDPGLRIQISVALDYLSSGRTPPPGGLALLTLLRQARAHAAEVDEWEIVHHLQETLDFAENRLSRPDYQERCHLLRKGTRDGSLHTLLTQKAMIYPRYTAEKGAEFLKKHPKASARDLVKEFAKEYRDSAYMLAPYDRPGRYLMVRGISELELWLDHAVQSRIDVEDIVDVARRIASSPETLSLIATDEEGELILRAAELRRRHAKLKELRTVVERTSALEKDLQSALIGQSWIFGGEYVGESAHRRLVVGDEIDIPLIRGDGSLHVVELKRSMNLKNGLVKRHRGEYVPTSSVNDAVAQAANYLVNLDGNRNEIKEKLGLETRRASATVLIGHPGLQSDVPEEEINEAMRKLNTMVSRVEVLTYKDLLDNAERAIGGPNPLS
ncbi:Shedu anti-phage system protein SduA domain-containing protein [Nocardiopsis mangrovi]|uniref:Shedu anti-phage system protein SduA domain-containing protein n=1 Tax=Nocardiopsis mangrovi TaxID=1179818 RepID=A0ABV9DY46_9ACTN